MSTQKRYPEELRERAVRLALESGRPVAHVARDLGVGPQSLRNWVSQAQADAGERAELLSTSERERLKLLERENRELRKANEIEGRLGVFRRGARPEPTEVSAFVDEKRSDFGVECICRTLGVSASAYYQRATGRRSERAVEDERLLGRIRELHRENYYAYGYRRMWKALLRAGERVPRCRVQRLMRTNAIEGAKRRGKPWRTTTPDPEARRRPDLVERDFSVERPNALWVADITWLRCWEGVGFFAFVIDAYSRMVVGWQLASHMRTDLVLDALRMALHQRGPGADVELVHHSDRGSQHLDRLHPGADRPPRAAIGRLSRRRLRQRPGRVVRRQLQDRADQRPRLAHPIAARARRRRVHRLVQPRPPPPSTRRPAPSRVRSRRQRIAQLALRARRAHHRRTQPDPLTVT